MKNNMKKICSIIMCLCLLLALASCGGEQTEKETTATPEAETEQTIYTDLPGSVKKSETVYVNTDCAGVLKEIIVSDWLHTDKAGVSVTDRSDLSNIINVKGDESPVADGENIVWNMGTTDLYYRGTSDKILPVNISVKYYLDGSEISASDLTGKSGSVKIEITMKNNITEVQNINGIDVKVCNPIFVAGGMILPESQFTNIEVSDGNAVSDGAKQIIVFAGVPGVAETLGLDEYGASFDAISFPETFTVTAEVTDFTLGNMYFAAIPLSAVTSGIEIPGTVEELEGTFSELDSLLKMVYEIDPQELINLISSNQDSISELLSAVKQASELYTENKALIGVFSKYMTQENIEALTKLVGDLQNTNIQQYAELLNNPLFKSFFKDISVLSADMEDLVPVMQAMQAELEQPEIASAVENLPATLSSLSAIISSVEENDELINAIFTLASEDNLSLIEKIINEVSDTQLETILDNFDLLSGVAEELVARFEAMVKFGEGHIIYSASAPNMQTSLAYIYRFDSIDKK